MDINDTVNKYLGEGLKALEDYENDYDNEREFLYMQDLLRENWKKHRMKIGKWECNEDNGQGSWEWHNGGDVSVYISPFWDGSGGAPVMWLDVETNEPVGKPYEEKFSVTGDPKKDFANYMKLAKKVINKGSN